MTLNELTQRLTGKYKADGSFQAICPCHDDKKASLNIRQSDEGKLLFCCYAGCRTEDILKSIDLTWKDAFRKEENFFPPDRRIKMNSNKTYTEEEIKGIAKYKYTDATGNPVMMAVRTKNKDFFQYSYAGEGKWKSGLNGKPPVLYNLPEVIKAVKNNIPVFIVEGEKDVETLRSLNLVGTTNPMGAGKWRPDYNCYFKDAKVILLPDNDNPGREHMKKVSENLKGIATLKYIELPELPEKGDVSDWTNAGNTKEKLFELIKNAPAIEEKEKSITDDIISLSFLDILNTTGEMEDNAIVSHLLYREGLSMIFGEPGCGKTWLTLDLIFNLVQGKKVWGRYNCEPHKVLLLLGDFSLLLLKHRFKNFSLDEEYMKNFRVLTSDGFEKKNYDYCLDNEKGKANMELMIQREKPDLIVIDSLCSFMEGDESKINDTKPILFYLRTLCQKFHIHIMTVHHARKRTSIERQGRMLDQSDMIGSSIFSRKVDSLFAVNTLYEDGEKIDNKGILTDTKRWLKYKVKFEYEILDNEQGKAEIKYTYENLESSVPKKQKAKDAIFNILFYDPNDAKTKAQLVHLTQINIKTVEIAIKKLLDEEKIEAIGKTQDRRYKIKNNSPISNVSPMISNNSLHTIKTWENNENNYIYQRSNSPIEDRRMIGECSEKQDILLSFSYGVEEKENESLYSETPYSPINPVCEKNIGETDIGELDDDFNREEIPF